MKLYAPEYYKNFKCSASSCRHSCCIGWEIGVEESCIKGFEKLGGDVADRFLASLVRNNDGATITLCDNGRCPHLLPSGLCSIISEVGDEPLPEICREHPRFYNLFANTAEVGIGAVCEVAADLIVKGCNYNSLVYVGEIEKVSCEVVWGLSKRRELFYLLQDKKDNSDKIDALLEYIDAKDALNSFNYGVFAELEYLEKKDKSTILSGLNQPYKITDEGINILSYFIYRHASSAVREVDFVTKVLFSIISMQCILGMERLGISLTEALRIYSLEIEYSIENTEALLFEIECGLL